MARLPSSDLLWTGFALEGEAFALPAGCVERVLDAGRVTTLPFAPAGVEGVASVSGDVVPVLALAALLFPDRPEPAEPGAQFLVAVFAGQRFALRVDDMLFVAVSLSEESGGAARWRDQAVTCLDPERLGLAALEPSRPPSGAPGAVASSRDSRSNRDAAQADTRVLIVETAGRTYALPSHAVVELLDQAVITPLPLVPPVLRGATVVRGQPLLAFCLDRLLGGDGAATPRGHVVLSVGRSSRLVLLVEAIVGLQRLSEATSAASPILLDPEKLIAADWAALAAQMPGIADAAPVVDTRRQRFLCVSLGGRTYAIALAAVERVLPPRQSVSLPAGAPAGIDGAIEYGGRIVPVTEGWRWLSLGEAGTTGAHIVLHQDGEQRVLAVNGVQRIVTIASDDILPTASHDPRIAALGTANGRSVEILSTTALLSRQDAA